MTWRNQQALTSFRVAFAAGAGIGHWLLTGSTISTLALLPPQLSQGARITSNGPQQTIQTQMDGDSCRALRRNLHLDHRQGYAAGRTHDLYSGLTQRGLGWKSVWRQTRRRTPIPV